MNEPQREMYPNEQFYVGVKRISAWPATNHEVAKMKQIPMTEPEQAGYAVQYSDGYLSWSPKDVFEKAYLPIGKNGTKIIEEAVNEFLGEVQDTKIDEKTTLVTATTLTGFKQYEVSSCVDPKNYDHEIGMDCATKRIKDRLWMCLGFVLQWANYGLKK